MKINCRSVISKIFSALTYNEPLFSFPRKFLIECFVCIIFFCKRWKKMKDYEKKIEKRFFLIYLASPLHTTTTYSIFIYTTERIYHHHHHHHNTGKQPSIDIRHINIESIYICIMYKMEHYSLYHRANYYNYHCVKYCKILFYVYMYKEK